MTSLEDLKNSKSIQDFAPLIGFTPAKLAYVLFKIPDPQKYKQFTILKKNGGERIINAPNEVLKFAQRRLADTLDNRVQEMEASQTQTRGPLAHGCKKGLKTVIDGRLRCEGAGIHTNAKCHTNRRYVLNLDLADFFPSFNFGRVRGFFISNNDFKLDPSVATLIAQIACFNNELPQGSPCSSIIANLITHILDVRLTRLAKEYRCTYSRYVDDITISTNQKVFPESLAILTSSPNQWQVADRVKNIIERSGFIVNAAKTRLQIRLSRQVVTGLVVNRKVNARKEYYRYARSMCNSLFSTGTFSLPGEDSSASILQLEGIISHLYFIKEWGLTEEQRLRHEGLREKAKNTKKRPEIGGVTELYSKFLYFRYFVALQRPLIICEGKTDVIYLKAAIKQLTKRNEYNFNHSVDFFRFTRRVNRVMQIYAGAPALNNFIEFYEQRTNSFKFQDRLAPVIVLVDNDEEAQKILRTIEKRYNHNHIPYDRNTTFTYNVVSNLYLVLLPKLDDRDNNKIEDFFNEEVTSELVDGKSFSATNSDLNIQEHYSKHVLSTQVVRPHQDSIDFSKFAPLLDLISTIIEKHAKTKSQLTPDADKSVCPKPAV